LGASYAATFENSELYPTAKLHVTGDFQNTKRSEIFVLLTHYAA